MNKEIPAFPVVGVNRYSNGMSLRDWFAGMALQGLLANYDAQKDLQFDPRYRQQPDGQFNFRDVVAVNCYEFANAMLKERDK